MVDWAQYCRDVCMECEARRPVHTQIGSIAGDGGPVPMSFGHTCPGFQLEPMEFLFRYKQQAGGLAQPVPTSSTEQTTSTK